MKLHSAIHTQQSAMGHCSWNPCGVTIRGCYETDCPERRRRARTGRDPRVARFLRVRSPARRPGPRRPAARCAEPSRAPVGRARAVLSRHAVRQHHPGRRAAAASGQPGDRTPHQKPHPLERVVDGRAREPDLRRDRRPHLDVRVGRDALRGRLQPFLPGQEQRQRRRPDLFPGTRVPRHLRARVPRRPALGREARELPARAQAGRRPVVLPASVADAGLLGVPDGLDGPRADHGDLPGALSALPRGSRAQEALRHENLGVSGRRRN